MERFRSYSSFLKEYFGEKVYKICLNGGFSCPNRDGRLSTKGCSFCSRGGSGEFSGNPALSITEQILSGKKQTGRKYHGNSYIAYFQAFTNTYAPVEHLRKLYMEALAPSEIKALAIATRPDCLSDDILALLSECSRLKPVFLELGLQTCHDTTAARFNRGYKTEVFDEAVKKCHRLGLRVCVHLILGLPGEDRSMIRGTIDHINRLPVAGVKLSMLHILKDTPLADLYGADPFYVFSLEDYVDCVIQCIEALRPDIVVERITGDGPKDLLIAPQWSGNKKKVLNTIRRELDKRNTWQGRTYHEPGITETL